LIDLELVGEPLQRQLRAVGEIRAADEALEQTQPRAVVAAIADERRRLAQRTARAVRSAVARHAPGGLAESGGRRLNGWSLGGGGQQSFGQARQSRAEP